jgi:hypothetical protein
MEDAAALCLTPVGPHLHINWFGMDFRVQKSDAVAYREIVDFAINYWRQSTLPSAVRVRVPAVQALLSPCLAPEARTATR